MVDIIQKVVHWIPIIIIFMIVIMIVIMGVDKINAQEECENVCEQNNQECIGLKAWTDSVCQCINEQNEIEYHKVGK